MLDRIVQRDVCGLQFAYYRVQPRLHAHMSIAGLVQFKAQPVALEFKLGRLSLGFLLRPRQLFQIPAKFADPLDAFSLFPLARSEQAIQSNAVPAPQPFFVDGGSCLAELVFRVESLQVIIEIGGLRSSARAIKRSAAVDVMKIGMLAQLQPEIPVLENVEILIEPAAFIDRFAGEKHRVDRNVIVPHQQ